jgi:DNA-binding transcriptional MerR regulator
MLKISDFAQLSRVSAKALRLYDQMGLLKPLHVDSETGYRYYSATQLPRLNRILVLKDLGFSLEQIAQLLNENVTSEAIRGMLQLKQAEIQQRLQADKLRLQRIEYRLQQFNQENKMTHYDVMTKSVAPQLVATVAGIIPNYDE